MCNVIICIRCSCGPVMNVIFPFVFLGEPLYFEPLLFVFEVPVVLTLVVKCSVRVDVLLFVQVKVLCLKMFCFFF